MKIRVGEVGETGGEIFMADTATNNWREANMNYLLAAVAVMHETLARYSPEGENAQNQVEAHLIATLAISEAQRSLDAKIAALPAPSALDRLCSTFGLSNFERHVLLLCAGMELDIAFPYLCAKIQCDEPKQAYPTFSLALGMFPDHAWDAVTPVGPLRRWKLIEVGDGPTLTLSPLRINEWVLHFLVGASYLDEKLKHIITPLSRTEEYLVPTHQQQAQQLAATWWQASEKSPLPIIQLCGDEIASKKAIASHACKLMGWNLYLISADNVPTKQEELPEIILLWEREVSLNSGVLFLDCDDLDGVDIVRENAIARLIEKLSSPLIISSRERRRQRQRPLITFDIRPPTPNEQRTIWQEALGDLADINGQVETLVSQFNLSASRIHAACTEALGRMASNHGHPIPEDPKIEGSQESGVEDSHQSSKRQPNNLTILLWDTCRAQVRPRLDDLAQPIESSAGWDDLVLPAPQRQVLGDIVAHVRQRAKVYRSWGFASKGDRGLGISALFAGSSGTGKTMSAEVLAKELRLDLYRIDLSSVVSKYIGETEKNLRRVFDAAEGGAAILLFDEADALFGKRSEVKDSHDRYANMEVSYLLQRMEAYQGLAILTTNLKNALDSAFTRRLRFIVQYPFPDTTQRTEIWKRIFPKNTPTEGLNIRRLAQLNVAGGNIRNIALNAAFQAAEAGEPVMMKHILYATRSEYSKMERILTDAEIKGWF